MLFKVTAILHCDTAVQVHFIGPIVTAWLTQAEPIRLPSAPETCKAELRKRLSSGGPTRTCTSGAAWPCCLLCSETDLLVGPEDRAQEEQSRQSGRSHAPAPGPMFPPAHLPQGPARPQIIPETNLPLSFSRSFPSGGVCFFQPHFSIILLPASLSISLETP